MKHLRLPAAIITVAILLLICLGCPPPKPVWVDVVVCGESHVLPTENCPATVILKFEKGHEPHDTCPLHPAGRVKVCDATGKRAAVNCSATHEVPTYEAPEFYCLRHARTRRAGPIFVMADLGVQCHLDRYSDEELGTYSLRTGGAGIDCVRTYYPSGDDGLPSVFPYEREPDGRWNLDRPNPQYDVNLRRFAVALSKYEVGVYVDMADQCGELEWTSCWHQNVNGVWGWHDESDLALIYWKAAVDRVLADIGGPEGNIIGFGNELKHSADDDVGEDYIRKWGKPRLDYLLSLGVKRPIPFSGSGRFAHKMMGYLSEEDGWYPGYDFVALVEHGIGLVEHTPPGETSLWDWLTQGHSVLRFYGYSDDGAGRVNSWSHIPEGKRGPGNKAGTRYAANTAEKIRTLQLFYHAWGPNLFLVEFLPSERSDDQPLSALADESLEAFWRIGIEVFGVDPRRNFN